MRSDAGKPRRGVLAVALLAALGAGGRATRTAAPAQDWPEFRGPSRDGRSRESGPLVAWPAEGPRALWRIDPGSGYSVGGILYVRDEKQLVALDVSG